MPDLNSIGCSGCRSLPTCGGWRDNPDDFFGCFDQCRIVRYANGRPGCAAGTCKITCPNNPRLFRLRTMEVEGLENTRCGPLLPLPPTSLPAYIPYLRSGLPQSNTLDVRCAAINLYEAIRKLRTRGTPTGYQEMSAVDFRRKLRLRDDCQILLVGVAKDPPIELFWSRFTKAGFASLLAPLNILGVTVPNFSFALDVTRYEHLYSRRRIMVLAEKFSAAGIPVAIHINAANRKDWDVWGDVLEANPTQHTICQEFETGLAAHDAAQREMEWMHRLEQRIGRKLHPVMVSGGHHIPLFDYYFKNYTIVSATPYMRAVNRFKAEGWSQSGRPHWQSVPSQPGECLTNLLKHNIDADQRWSAARVHCVV